MNRPLALILLLAAASTSACTVPSYEAEPTSVYQWQRRQDAIERQYNERVRLCANTKEDDPRKEENCRGVTGAKQ
ncbi:hypothetical protein [Brevundimonas sp. Root1279]|uniref:hypothetical protein n=1 Tax=Brevundimonas sp. Root1279 TaxID=1736443 RepID=UPI0006F4061C|nr:hypothetical protein [Brevundimonas sp. Root1279]KQW83653.1 hypothetical protein ASC65_03080 [Brevundimonas sp. Root1279]